MKNIESKINWLEFYSNYLQGMKKTGANKMSSACSFHNDNHPSFWFNINNGCFKCEACGESGNGQTFLEKKEGLSSGEAYQRILKLAGEYMEPGKSEEKYTLEHYSKQKKLPMEFLNSLKLKNYRDGIEIPYFDIHGDEICKRRRYAGKKFIWARGSSLNLYGLWKLETFMDKGYIILVEGESDAQTLWYHDIPALGVPGANTFRAEWADTIKDFDLYIHREPDMGGEAFVKRTREELHRAGFDKRVYEISTPGFKDPSELHIHKPEEFDEIWGKVLRSARPVEIKEISPEIKPLIEGAPVNHKLPNNYNLSEGGIFAFDRELCVMKRFCRTPVLITKRIMSIESSEEKLEIAFLKDGLWHRQIVQRSVLFKSRTIIQLSDIGISVTSENAKNLVKFLSDLLDENMDIIERVRSVSQMGWQGDKFLPYAGGDIILDCDENGGGWIEGYRMRGSFEEWKDMIRGFRNNHIFRFILSCSFAAPLLKIMNHRIFVIHNWGNSRFGKTAALKAALSVWGNPESLMCSFNATKVGLERMASFFRDLPLGIDEKQVLGDKQEFMESMVYMLFLGKSKLRGTKAGGLQAASSWRSIILTTGEEAIITSSTQGGINTRVMEIYGAPFDREEDARKIHEFVEKNHGFAGREFIGKIISREGFEEELKGVFEYFKGCFKHNGGNSIHMLNAALVASADVLVSELIFKEPWDKSIKAAESMGLYILQKLSEEQEDVNDKAYEYIKGWVLSNNEQFDENAKPRYGFNVGRTYYIFPHLVQEALEKKGFSYRKTVRALGEKELIGRTCSGGSTVYSVSRRFEGSKARLIELRIE